MSALLVKKNKYCSTLKDTSTLGKHLHPKVLQTTPYVPFFFFAQIILVHLQHVVSYHRQ